MNAYTVDALSSCLYIDIPSCFYSMNITCFPMFWTFGIKIISHDCKVFLSINWDQILIESDASPCVWFSVFDNSGLDLTFSF